MAINERYRFWFVVGVVALIAGGALLRYNDQALKASVYGRAQQLESVGTPAAAQCIVSEWRSHGFTATVTRGILLDTVPFVPAYVILLMVSCFWCASRLVDAQIRRAAVVLGYSAIVVGALDWLENAGMLIELHWQKYCLAPYTAGAAGLKWLLATVIVLFLLGVLLQGNLLLRQNGVHRDPNGG